MQDFSISFCPVPDEQQPLNEYQQLKEAWPFRWPTLPKWVYLRKLAWVWFIGGLFTGPIAAASFPWKETPFQWFLAASGGALGFVFLMLMRIYLGWFYIRDRLQQAKIEYEESGWYDGQTWEKPPEMQMRDRLVVTYQVQPLLKRLYKTFGLLTVMGVICCLLFLVMGDG